jgi:hypothetical protein
MITMYDKDGSDDGDDVNDDYVHYDNDNGV